MSRRRLSILLVAALATAVGLARPTDAASVRMHGSGAHAFAPSGGAHGFGHRGSGHHRHFHSFSTFVVAPPIAVVPFAPDPIVVAPPPVVYAPPPVVYAPPVTYAPPMMSAPPAYAPPPVAVVPPPPPTPRVVEYPGGRYELRGDGVAMPHTWVWIPNPPSGPPDSSASASRPSDSSGRTERARSRAYRWVDDDGVVNWTNDPDRIPERYRPRRTADGSRL